MRRGEAVILATMAVVVVGVMARNVVSRHAETEPDPGIPFYSTADAAVTREAGDLYRDNNCRHCHSLWTLKSPFESVPAPALDGIGSLRSEEWLYQYLSSGDPQHILPSRLKPEYRMPSYADLPERQRRVLARYLASLKVKDWYLERTRAAEYEKLTGMTYPEPHADK